MPVNFNVRTKIKINGREYSSPEEMPPDVRRIYEKALANRQSSPASVQVKTNSRITFNGQSFNSLDEMPADVRRVYESILSAVDKDGDGIPDSSPSDGDSTFEPSAPFLAQSNTYEVPLEVKRPLRRRRRRVSALSGANSRVVLFVLTGLLLLLLLGALLLASLSR